MSSSLVLSVGTNFSPDHQEPVMDSLLSEYRRVIFESLVSAFALDGLLVQDRHGGDVDTIHNVRKIDVDPQMTYKNVLNQRTYKANGEYDTKTYHNNTAFRNFKKSAKEEFQKTGTPVKDAYTGKDLYFVGKAKGRLSSIAAEADHVISAKSIHTDRGRVLSGLKGTDLANDPSNLKFTNKSLNASMGAKEIPDYLAKHPELDKTTKDNMMREYNQAKNAYENKLARAYYGSQNFVEDVKKAAGKVGVQMGARQVLGFVFTEVTFTVLEEFKHLAKPFSLEKLLQSLGNGIRKGFENARKKYKELLSRLTEGAISGVLSSLTTTLCNIFFTTAKNVVRIIRQTYVSLVQAAKILFLNPDNLPFGERIRATAKILSLGAGVVLGSMVSELVEQTPVGKIPVLGEVVPNFCGALVSGLLTCSLVYFLDRSERMNRLVASLNGIHTFSTEVNYFRKCAEYFERYAAELAGIDYEKFRKETEMFANIAANLKKAADPKQLNAMLRDYLVQVGGALPWEGDFDTFMQQKEKPLVFC